MKRKKGKPAGQTIDELVELGRQHVDRGELAEAEVFFRQALAKEPDNLGTITLLGLLLVEEEKFEPAVELLEVARDAAPGAAPIQLALGSAYAGAGHDSLAVSAMEAAIKIETQSTVPLERLAKHHIVARRPREAIGLLRRVLRRDPTNAHAKFLLAGLTSDKAAEGERPAVPETPPAELIADLFDAYASNFEQHLVEKLHYAVPEALAALVAGTGVLANASWRVVDLGCGTGLAGVAFRRYAKTLIGSDLSPRMVARSRARNVYDSLHVEDLVATLTRERDLDLVVAADVFIYVGALEATFAACAGAIKPGGLLAFSVERSDGEDLVLRATLRYSQSDAYIRRLASAHEFAVEVAQEATLRVEETQPVPGVLYLLRR